MNHQADYLEQQLKEARAEAEELRFMAAKAGDSIIALSNELAELRKRACVPDVDVVVPVESLPAMMKIEHHSPGIAIEKDILGTVHIKIGDFDYIQIKYQYPHTDNARQLRHAMLIADVLTGAAPQPAPTACTGKNCGSTDPNLHSADCFAEHERAITPNAARKAPPEDPLCGIEYRADGEANFYTLSAAAGSWVARIQFNGRLYPHEQERILSAMIGDRNVRYGDGYYDGYWSARKDCAFEQDVAGLPFVRKILEKLERFRECAEDDEGVDIGRNWLDMLTRLGLLNRVQRSPARWEMTAQADDALEAAHQSGGAR